MNVAEAQREARANPKIKAAVCVSFRKAAPGAGITDDPACEVELFPLVRDASARFKERKDRLEAAGLKLTYGTVGRGLVILERADPPCAVSMSLVRRPAKNPSKGG